MHKLFTPLIVLPAVGACLAASAHGQIVFAEYFDYALSSGTNIHSAPGWSGNTNNVRFRTEPGPNFIGTGYLPTHAGGVLESGGSNTTEVRTSHAALGQALSGEFWVATFVNATGMNNPNGSTTLMSFSTNNTSNSSYGGPGFGLYNNGTDLNFALFDGLGGVDGVATVGSAATANQWNLLLARITINTDADDAISVWAFDMNANVPTTVAGLGTPVVTSSTLDIGNSINTLGVGGQSFTTNGGKLALWDDIRVTSLGGDAGLEAVLIPEPSTYAALFALLALSAVWLRRRKP